MTKTQRVLSAVLLLLCLCTQEALAFEPDETYTYNVNGMAVYSPHVYRVGQIIDAGVMGCTSIKDAQDIYMDSKDHLYILDSGNKRVIVLNEEYRCICELAEFRYNGETVTLADGAQGIFFQEAQELLYIADTKNDRIIVSDLEGNVSRICYKPEHELLASLSRFSPRKIIVDNMGLIFVTSANVNTGALLIDANNEFLGFYGTNTIKETWQIQVEYMWRSILTDAQNAQSQYSFQPTEFFNICWSNDRFVYAVSPLSDTIESPVMKLNALGENVLPGDVNFGDLAESGSELGQIPTFTDITVDNEGVFTILDSSRGRLFQYDEECNMLGIFGGIGYQRGLFSMPTSIESDSENRILVLDATKNTITVMEQTHYGKKIREATALHNEGRYEAAMESWREIIRMNSNYDLAYVGIGKAYMKLGNYEAAMENFKLAGDRTDYAEARECLREEWMRQHFSAIAAVVIAGMVLVLGWEFIWRMVYRLWRNIVPKRGGAVK